MFLTFSCSSALRRGGALSLASFFSLSSCSLSFSSLRRRTLKRAASSRSRRWASALISLSSCLADFWSSTQSSIRSLLEDNVSSFPTRAWRILSFSPDQ
ncbi:hypothetical protein EYF80_002538 [Liparis tanakae]|uniref:Uncharacterized protein n=1 Tax=Liparis tanakae TaxID=230148 RepID=A0A4Z2JBG3_9TELE|nr:hypothetical protein EYF80_002538 [Liparis tanakae]